MTKRFGRYEFLAGEAEEFLFNIYRYTFYILVWCFETVDRLFLSIAKIFYDFPDLAMGLPFNTSAEFQQLLLCFVDCQCCELFSCGGPLSKGPTTVFVKGKATNTFFRSKQTFKTVIIHSLSA